jgi:rubrerythrin
MKWKCDECGATFDLQDIPEKCPKCGRDDGTFSLVD